MSSQPLELARSNRPGASQPLPLIAALPFITVSSGMLWLLIGRVAKAMLGL